MRKQEKTIQEKEAIIAEYLMGEITYRKLEKKHGVDFRLIHSWVTKFQGKPMRKEKPKSRTCGTNQPEKGEQLPTDIKQLQEELRTTRLHNKLLNAIIDIAEEQLKINIRKKPGTKR